MKKVLLVITVLAFCFSTTAYAKTTETTNKVGSYFFMFGLPTWMGILASNSAFIGAWQVAGAGLIALGAYKEYKGDWGKDGKYAYKPERCADHVNNNCAHLKLSEIGTGGINTNNFATTNNVIDGIEGVSVN